MWAGGQVVPIVAHTRIPGKYTAICFIFLESKLLHATRFIIYIGIRVIMMYSFYKRSLERPNRKTKKNQGRTFTPKFIYSSIGGWGGGGPL